MNLWLKGGHLRADRRARRMQWWTMVNGGLRVFQMLEKLVAGGARPWNPHTVCAILRLCCTSCIRICSIRLFARLLHLTVHRTPTWCKTLRCRQSQTFASSQIMWFWIIEEALFCGNMFCNHSEIETAKKSMFLHSQSNTLMSVLNLDSLQRLPSSGASSFCSCIFWLFMQLFIIVLVSFTARLLPLLQKIQGFCRHGLRQRNGWERQGFQRKGFVWQGIGQFDFRQRQWDVENNTVYSVDYRCFFTLTVDFFPRIGQGRLALAIS